MNLKIYYLTSLIGLVVAGIASFIDIKIGAGILMATVFSMINLMLLSLSMKAVINSESKNTALLVGGNIVRYSMLVLCMFIAYKFPQYFSLIGVAIGMTLFLFALVIDAISKRKG